MRKLPSFPSALLCLCAVLLAACGPAPTRPTVVVPTGTPSPSASSSALDFCISPPVPFETLLPYPTPEGPDPPVEPALAQVLPPGVAAPEATEYPVGDPGHVPYLVGQKQIGRYSVREWQFPRTGSGVATISAGGAILAKVESFRLAVLHAGRDLTGEGHPDVVIGTGWVGGSYVGHATKVYDLGPTLTNVLDTPVVYSDLSYPSYYAPCPWRGEFCDLDRDGSAEFVTCDDAPEFEYFSASSTNPYAENRNLLVLAVLDYEPGQGYVPAGYRFPELYAGNLDTYTSRAEEEAFGPSNDETSRLNRALVALTMNYLYCGRPEKAWEELGRLYQGADKVFLWSQIVHVASRSPFYRPAGAFPEVIVPDYYAVQLQPGCESLLWCPEGPNEGEPTCTPGEWLAQELFRFDAMPVVMLQHGQSAGDPTVPKRSMAWLEGELRSLGLLVDHETLSLSRPDDATACRVEVVQVEEHTVLGVIEFDLSGGFPGSVRRVDLHGRAGTSWRLRGDLTWEPMPPH